MQLLVSLAVVGLLEELVGADLGFVKLAVVLDRRGGDVHVEAADGAVLVLDRVDGLDGLEDVLDRIVLGVLARLKEQALVAEVLERDHLVADLLLRELLAHDALVLGMVRAVRAGVDAVVREVERREEHDAAAVDVLLHLDGGLEDPVVDLLDVAGEQHGGFAVGQALELGGLVKDAHEQRNVRLVLFGVGERVADFLIVDELFRYAGLGVVNGHFFLVELTGVLWDVHSASKAKRPIRCPLNRPCCLCFGELQAGCLRPCLPCWKVFCLMLFIL